MQHRSSTRVLTWMRARSEVSFRLATIQSSLMDFSSLLILFSSIELCHCRLRYFFSFVGFRLLLFSQWVHEHNNKKRLYEEWQALLAIFIINNNNAYWVFHLTRNRDDVSNYRKNLEVYCTVVLCSCWLSVCWNGVIVDSVIWVRRGKFISICDQTEMLIYFRHNYIRFLLFIFINIISKSDVVFLFLFHDFDGRRKLHTTLKNL